MLFFKTLICNILKSFFDMSAIIININKYQKKEQKYLKLWN